jgi:hypothetical protein
MESVCGESNVWSSPSRRIVPSESVASESVTCTTYSSESISESISFPTPIRSSNYPETPRIKQLKKELGDLQAELELAQQIDQVKQKLKKYRG